MDNESKWILYYYLICIGAGPAFILGQYFYANGTILTWHLLFIIPAGVLAGLFYGTTFLFSVSFILIFLGTIFEGIVDKLRQSKNKTTNTNDFHVQVVTPDNFEE